VEYFAHSGEKANRSDWQRLSDHLHNVAKLAGNMAAVFGCSRQAFLAGLAHDLGKYNPAFQRRLMGNPASVDHSTAGAATLLNLGKGKNLGMAELIAYGIAGHHAGLPDKSSESPACLKDRLAGFTDELDPTWRNEIALDIGDLYPRHFGFDKAHAAFQFAFLGRMIFSCLVDADFKDTEAFYVALRSLRADRDWPSLQSLLPEFHAAFEAHMERMPKADTPVNRLRQEILTHVRGKASMAPGLFTLTVPTGGGKTLASLAFALDHAKAHGLRRIIYAIPFTSVIDQTAKIFRDVLGDDHILEHHSAIEEETPRERAGRDKLRLAMEDWAAPVVVTTNVQLFESLFAARPSKARKLHNIAGSVIILDEAQTLPLNLLAPCVRALDELARNYGCSIILCTATQPALDARSLPDHPAGLKLEGRELAPDPHRMGDAFKRITIRHGGEMSNTALIASLAETRQALVIVNSRKHALALYQEAKAAGLTDLVHLSTRQYAAHRKIILDTVRASLKAGGPCRVIATSLVEAGVDLDFPRVWRAEAGLDQIAQAAGRCNREGRRAPEESIVTIFSAPDFPPPAEISGLTGDMKRMAGNHADLLSPPALREYFEEVYWRKGRDGLDRKGILGRFKLGANDTDFAYRSAAEDFRLIESGMVPVIVARDDDARRSVAKLKVPEISSGLLARQLQLYIVQIPVKARDLLIASGRVAFACAELRADQFAVLQDEALYTGAGLIWEDAEYLPIEGLVI
jgi:CRISPR-associated endonuclease/helicase Cas3